MHCNLDYAFSFIYREEMNGLTEHELDHVFLGISDTPPAPDPAEVAAFQYMPVPVLMDELKARPAIYSKWLEICFDRVMGHHQQLFEV